MGSENDWGALWKGKVKGGLVLRISAGGFDNFISIKLGPSMKKPSVLLNSLE